MIVKFNHYPHRMEVWDKRFSLKGKGFWIDEDFPPEIKQEREVLRPYFNRALELKLKPKMVLNKLIFGGKAYTIDNIHSLPIIMLETTFTATTEDTMMFYGPSHPLSNTYPSSIVQDGTSYKSVEQYIQFRKAELNGNEPLAIQIHSTQDPYKVMKLGNTIPDTHEWSKLRGTIMSTALYLKFNQHQHLSKLLISTDKKLLIFASKHDNYWGCGLNIKECKTTPSHEWPGENVLGKLLMEIRSHVSSG